MEKNEARMASILARQTRAAEEKRRREQAVADAAAKAAERRRHVEEAWQAQSGNLDNAIAKLNAVMLTNGIQIVRLKTFNNGPAGQIESVEIKFSHDTNGRSIRCLMIHIGSDGDIHVRIATANQMPFKQYTFGIDQCGEERWTETLLDFVDVNTPA